MTIVRLRTAHSRPRHVNQVPYWTVPWVPLRHGPNGSDFLRCCPIYQNLRAERWIANTPKRGTNVRIPVIFTGCSILWYFVKASEISVCAFEEESKNKKKKATNKYNTFITKFTTHTLTEPQRRKYFFSTKNSRSIHHLISFANK